MKKSGHIITNSKIVIMNVKTVFKSFAAILVAGLSVNIAIAQSGGGVSINENNPPTPADPSAMLDVSSSNKGLLIPRMTLTQRNAIASPAEGLLVYVTDDNSFYYYNNTAWKKITIDDNQLWQLSGSDAYFSTGKVGIGTNNPVVELDIEGGVNIGNTADSTAGNIRWNGQNFEGYNGTAWVVLDNKWKDNGGGTVILDSPVELTGSFTVKNSTSDLFKISDNGGFVLGKDAGTSYTASSGVIIGENAGQSVVNGYRSVFIGADAGKLTTSESANSFIGYTSGAANTTGISNTFLGGYAGSANTTGNNNTYLGGSSGQLSTTASNNTFVGAASGTNNVTGDQNTYMGASAGSGATSSGNTFMGYSAGTTASGGSNTAIGSEASKSITTATRTTSLGYWSGKSMTTGSYNTLIGSRAGEGTTTGTNNTFLGYLAGYNNQTGNNNIVISTNQIDLPTTSTNDYLNVGNLIYGDMSVNKRVGINQSSPTATLDVNGSFKASGLAYPTSDGTSGQVLTTDGAGNLSWGSGSGGSSSLWTDDGDGSISYAGDVDITGAGRKFTVANGTLSYFKYDETLKRVSVSGSGSSPRFIAESDGVERARLGVGVNGGQN